MRALAIAATAALLATACQCGGPGVNGEEDGGDVAEAEDAGSKSETDAGCLPLSGEGTSIVDGLQRARRLAVDETHLYVSEVRSATLGDGRLLRVPLAGGTVEELAVDLKAPDAIVASAGVVFVEANDGLWKIDARTTAVSQVRINDTLNNALFGETELLLDGDSVILASGHRRLMRVKQDGSGSQVLHDAPLGSAVRGLARVGAELFFLVASGPEPGLYRVPLDGSTAAVRLRDDLPDGHYLAWDGTRLLISEGAGGAGRVVSVSLDGASAEDLVTGLTRPGRVLPMGGALYVKDRTTSLSPDFFRAITGCGVLPVGPTGIGPGDVVSAQGVLFFTSEGAGTDGYLSRLP